MVPVVPDRAKQLGTLFATKGPMEVPDDVVPQLRFVLSLSSTDWTQRFCLRIKILIDPLLFLDVVVQLLMFDWGFVAVEDDAALQAVMNPL